MRDRICSTTIAGVPLEDDPLIYRPEVMAIIGALADLVVEVRRIRELLEDEEETD